MAPFPSNIMRGLHYMLPARVHVGPLLRAGVASPQTVSPLPVSCDSSLPRGNRRAHTRARRALAECAAAVSERHGGGGRIRSRDRHTGLLDHLGEGGHGAPERKRRRGRGLPRRRLGTYTAATFETCGTESYKG